METTYKTNLQKKKKKLRKALEEGKFEKSNSCFDDVYLHFLNTAADLDVALKTQNWENADEILDTLLFLDPKFRKEKYAIIVYKLLEDADV